MADINFQTKMKKEIDFESILNKIATKFSSFKYDNSLVLFIKYINIIIFKIMEI